MAIEAIDPRLRPDEILAIGDVIRAGATTPDQEMPFELIERRLRQDFDEDELSVLQEALSMATDLDEKRRILNGAFFIREVRLSAAGRSETQRLEAEFAQPTQ